MKVLLLGATGFQGRRTAAELARSEEVDELVLAGTNEGRITELMAMLGGRRHLRTIVVDGTDVDRLAGACEEVDILISCAGPAYQMEQPSIEASVAAGIACVTLCDDQSTAGKIVALDPAAVGAGTTIVSGCGLSPGLTNVLAVFAASQLEEVTDINIATAYSLNDYLGPALVTGLIRTFSMEAAYVSEWRRLSGRAGDLPELSYLPGPVGWVETFTCGHPEVLSLQNRFSDIRSLRYRFGLTERAGMDVVRGPATWGLARTDLTRRAWARLLRTFQPALSSMPPRGSQWTGVRVDARGRIDGRSTTISLGVADRLPNLVSSSLTYAALQLGTGRVTRPGINAPEDALDPIDFLGFLYRRGIRVARLTPALYEEARS